jgi:hypothetical protein
MRDIRIAAVSVLAIGRLVAAMVADAIAKASARRWRDARAASDPRLSDGRVSYIPDDRELTTEERTLVEWLLRHGREGSGIRPGASAYLDQLPTLRVWSRCACGCASINPHLPPLEGPGELDPRRLRVRRP